MISLNISDVRSFMAKLLVNKSFDHLILKEMEIHTFTSFRVTGNFYEDFFSDEEVEERKQAFVFWGNIREIAYTIIKGEKSPLFMKIVLQIPIEQTASLVEMIPGIQEEDVGGLYINIRFEKGKLNIITGTAMKTFNLDKHIEREWDSKVKEFLRQEKISFEEE